MAGQNNACLPNLQALIAAGIDPKTGLPKKATSDNPAQLKEGVKKALRIIDEQDAVNRYVWKNLPKGLNSQLLERLIYYRGQLCFFYNQELDQYYIMPYALQGGIDFYGRYLAVHPVPFANGSTDAEKRAIAQQREYLSTLVLKPQYDIVTENKEELKTTGCVILKDYTEQQSQSIVSRQVINDVILDVEAECIPFMRTALINGTGVQGMRVESGDEYSNVAAANDSLVNAALNGAPNVPVLGHVDFQELNSGEVSKSEEYMMAFQSIDNFRLSTYGLENGGLFQKKERKLVAEQEMNADGGSGNLVMEDGLLNRTRFAEIVNSIWDLNISVQKKKEEVEEVTND